MSLMTRPLCVYRHGVLEWMEHSASRALLEAIVDRIIGALIGPALRRHLRLAFLRNIEDTH